jgi:transcriptional activator cubitus interruptus
MKKNWCFLFFSGDLRGDDDEKPTIDSQGKHVPVEGEPDFIETNCHWENCSLEFPTQDDLVKVLQNFYLNRNLPRDCREILK